MITAIRALILDFDGVILESNALKVRAFERVCAQFPEHLTTMMAHYRQHQSASRYDKFRHLVTQYLGKESDDPLVDRLASEFSAEMLSQVAACAVVPGALEFLADVTPRIPVFLASVTPEDELRVILSLRGLTHHFTRVYGCPPWTKTSAIADILARLGGVHGVVFVGDSAGDQRAAIENGVEFIGRDSGLPFDSPLPPRGRDMVEVHALLAPRLRVI